MGSNRFYLSVVAHCLLIFFSAFLCFYFLQVRQQPNSAVGMAVFALLLTFRMIYYVNRTNRILGNFLSYMQESDPSLHYSLAFVKRHFKGLKESMESLIGELKEARIDLEVQAHYLAAILDNVSTGILCFDDSGKIEIMNSITPIITLSTAIRRKLGNREELSSPAQISGEVLQDALQSASIIEERSKGLVKFIERYKKLTSLPPMTPERISVNKLFDKIEQLFREDLKNKGTRIYWAGPCRIEIEADRQMLEQVMINLVKNALEALRDQEDPVIELACYHDSADHICLSVRDNGEGISGDKLEQVFIPFFTTREEGSGIGLSLCRQIISLHGGSIRIDSEPGQGTRVEICLIQR
ncbi:MAG: ATP-binding protein [Bacteroidales bacterium]|nr:ATP-binding protein [Bacteroidales bacterium]